jgi:uncharacterized protein YggE
MCIDDIATSSSSGYQLVEVYGLRIGVAITVVGWTSYNVPTLIDSPILSGANSVASIEFDAHSGTARQTADHLLAACSDCQVRAASYDNCD